MCGVTTGRGGGYWRHPNVAHHNDNTCRPWGDGGLMQVFEI